MAISATTDWSKIRYVMLLVFATSVLLASTVATGLATSVKQKRQLFRENLLPQQGGKIPESAFRPDRLALNRLNQQGVYSSEGYYLEQRRPDVHFHPKLWTAETLKLTVRPDNRYVAPIGRYYYQSPRIVDTTYLIREPTSLIPFVPLHRALPLAPHTSLKILRHHLHHTNDIHASAWNEVFPPNEFAEQIFAEFAPYLKKFL